MPTFNDPNEENKNNQLQPRFKPFSVDEEMMSPADQQLGNEVSMILQAQRDKKLEDDYFQTVRDNANVDEETRFARADKYFAERYGIETHRGAAINSGDDYKMKPFESSSAYENALVTMAEKGYEGIASERYRNLLASERLGDEAATKAEIIKQAQIETEEDVDDLSKPYVTSPGVVTYQKIRQPRKQEDIDRDVAEYRANVLGENFVALFEHFRPDLSEEGERIVRAVVKNGSLPADEHTAFTNLYSADPKQGDLVKFLAEQAKETKYDLNGAAGRGMAGMLKQIIEGAGEKIGQGLYRFSSGLDAMDYAWTGSSADRLNRMNRTERDEYERLRAEGLGEQQAIDNVAGQMQKRFLDEMLCLEDRTRSRRAELALKDLMAKREWEHYGYWENAYIGAATTVPYMAVTAVPYAGFAVNVFSHMQDVEDQIIREGGDPTKAQAARAIGAVAWSAIEKMELKGFGRSLTKLEKSVMWRHLWQGQAKMALGELGTAAKIGGKDILLNWAKETGQEGLQGTIESIETDLGLDKDAADIFKNALVRTWEETKNSAGTMAIISTAFPIGGAVIRAPFQRRKMQDRESVVAYITRQEQLKNMLQGAQLSDQGTPEMQNKRVTKAYNEIQNVWDASATPQVAMEKYQEIGYTEDEAVKIAEYFDMRSEILRNAARLPETQGLRDAMIAGNAFRVGQDTTFNPADLFHLINANIVTEEVEVPTPGAANAAPQKALRVTVPMTDANGAETTKDFTVVVNNETPDIETPAFASSVAQATQGTEVQKTAEEYLAMSRDEKEAFLLANDLKRGGDFQVLDQDGKTIFSSDALVQLARANSAFVRKGGNWTLAHETAHGIVAFARQIGVFDPDADTTKVMVKLFGGPTNDKEAWNEERMADGFAEYLRGKYDFKGLSRDERGIVERVFDAVIDFFKNAYYRLTGKTPDPAAVELKAREQALDAVFEGIRSGDFSGLSAFAGIDFGEDQEKDAAQKPQEGPSTASATETKNEPSATEEAVPEAPGTVSAPSAATTAAEERVKQAHAAQNGVKVTQATPTQASLQAQLARIEAKLSELTADPKGAAANVPTPRKTPKGEETRATPQGGVKFKIAWQWIPRAELVTSDKAEYPQEFQPRDRASRVASDLQVIENTRPGRFDPMKLAYSYDSDGGAPIVAGGNVVLSGNGRSMMIGQLAKEGRYADYLAKISDWADEYGIGRPPAGMKDPVLVQRITSTEKREDLLKIAELSNQAKILTRSEAENAEADAKLITPTMMRLFRPSEDGDLQAASNADFMQAFIASAPDAKGLTNADGTPTDQAVRRVQNALLSAVLGKDQTTRALLKTLLEKRGDLGLGDLYRALIKSSGALLSNRTAKASFDLLPHIRRAVGQYVSWRSARLSNPRYTLDEHLRTRDMFASAPSKETEAVARLLEAGRFGRVLDKYNELVAQKAPDAQASFFAEDTAYQTLAKAERAVLLEGETPVTLDPNDALAAEPLQSPPAEVTPAPVAVEPEPTTDEPAPAPAPVQEEATTFEPQPVRRGTATVPAQNAEKIVAYNVNAEGQPTTAKKILPVGAYNLLRGPYDVRKPPKASVQDKAGRGLGIGFTAPTNDERGRYWGKIFPHFQGNKTEMADRTSQAIRKLMPKAERESYKTVVDYFGGGGCWGLYHALTNFPNADRLAINEWEQGRIAKIRLLHEKGAAVADEASKLIIEDLYAELKKACMVGEGNTESGSGTTIASKLEPMAERYRNDENKLGLIYAVVDCARTMLANRTDAAGKPSFDAGFDAIIDNLREDGKKAKEAADAFKARGGTITYRQGDAANYAEAPAGTDVVAVCDPPYYLTAGYNGQVSVPIDANGMGWDYKTTRRMLDGLVDKGDAIVYTDEAWWFKETYTPDQQEDLFGGGSPFAQEQEILLGIINALDHFDVAGRVVGRQEVLGINHGHKTTDGRAEGVAGTPRGAGETAEGAADGRGVQGNHPGDALEGLAAGAEGQDAALLGDGAGRGREGDAESVALAREIAAVQIEEAAADAGVQVTPNVASIIRSSVRQVREKHILAYAKTVSKNAKAWIKRQEKALDRPADPVAFIDELPIPLEMRANRDFTDLRFSVTMGERAKEEARAAIEKYRPDYGLWVGLTTSKIDAYEKTYQNETRKASTDDYGNMDDEFLDWMQGKEVDLAVDDIAAFPTPKERKAALLWFCKDTVRLPEDHAKVVEAIKTAERAKVDPMQFERPGDILEQFAEYRPKGKPINPDKVPELTDRKDMGHGIVTYLVQNDKAGQAAMRQIINTHWGVDANPWCLLQGDGNGNLTDDAWDYWQRYNALPKRVAFKNGKLLAFMATDDTSEADEQWWDRNDASHDGIPLGNMTVPGDTFGRWADFEIRDGELKQIGGYHKGNRGASGYVEWYANGLKESQIVKADEEYYDWENNGDLYRARMNGVQFNFEEGVLQSVYAKVDGKDIYINVDENLAPYDIEVGAEGNYSVGLDDDGNIAAYVESLELEKKLQAAYDKLKPHIAEAERIYRENRQTRLYKFSIGRTNADIRYSVRTAWTPDFPKATCMTTRASLMAKHGELFNKAKAGDSDAAADLIEAVVKPEKLRELAAAHPNAIVVPVHAEEATGLNKLPRRYADYIGALTGLEVDTDIVQSVRAFHSGADAAHRLFVQPEFDGRVQNGREYIVVDDHITQGGTVNALRDHIEANGGKVVAVASLTLSQGSSKLSPRKETIDEIKRKWPDVNRLLRSAGIAERAEALTESQLRYILKFSPDTFRDRIAQAGIESDARRQYETLGAPPSEGVARDERHLSPENEKLRHSIITYGDGKMTDINGRPVPRHSVRRGNRPMKAEDVAAGFLAARFLAGKETSVEDADRMLKNVGLRVDAPAMLERAKALADRNRDRLRASVEAKSPDVIAALANANLQDRATDAFNTAITTGAAAADPDIGVSMQRTADRFAARELQTSKGFTAAQMQAELPISLADAVFAVAEYEKTPEEKARLEEWKKKRDEEKAAAEEARKADPDAETPIEEAERLARDLSYREPSAEERAYFDQLMDRARFADEARAQEELRQKLAEQKKKDTKEANADNADNDAEGAADEKAEADAILPFDTVKRIAPVFESAELFAQFVVEWTTDHILKKHPELQNREDVWKSPVAVKELVKTAQHLLRDLAKQTLGSPSINAARNYVDQAIINLADYKTFRAIRKNVAHIYDRIHDNALRISRRKLVSELIYGKRDNAGDGPGFKGLRALAGIKGRFSATTEAGDRAIDAKTELWCRWLIPYLTMTEEALQKEEDRLRAIISRHDTEDEAYGYDKEDNTKYAEAKDRLAMLNVYGGMVRWLPGKIIDAREQILEQVNGKRQAFEQARAEREAEDKTIRDAIIAAVEAGASDDYLHRSEVGDRLDRILYSFNGNLTLEMQNLIRFCKDPAKREAALLAIEDLSVIMSRGTERYRVTLATARKEVNDGIAAYYGNAEVGIRHLMHDQVPEDVAKRIFTQSRQKVQTYGQLLQLYATTIQADYKENAEKHGRTANLELMENTLTPQDIAFHAWAVNWYAANREALSDAVEEITGLGVTSPDRLYCPARMDRDPDGFAVDAVAWSPIPSALNRRVAHGLDFNEAANFLTCVMEQAEVRAQTIGYGMTGIRLRDIIAHHELQKAVRKHVGRADMRLVTDHVKDVLVQGAAKKDAIEWLAPLNFARKWMARFYLSGNIPSALKQLASMPVWANAMLGGQEIGLQKCLGYLTSVGTEDGRQAIEDLIKSDGFKARYQMGWSEEIQNLLTHPSKNRLVRYFEKAYDKGMMVNKAVDAVSCLWMAQGFYRDAKALFERRGFTPEQAKDNALAITWSVCENGQQSGRIENMNKAQRHGGALVSAVFQFKTAFLLQNNYIIQAISDTRAGTPGAKGRLARGLFINTVYIPAFVAVVNALWSAVMGDKEPPEDPEKAPQWLKDFAWSMIEGVTAPLFMTGSIIHAGFDAIFGKTGYADNASIPAVEGIMRVGKHAGKAMADTIALITPMDVAEEVTPEKVKEDLLRLAADIAAPVRHVRKAIKNRTED